MNTRTRAAIAAGVLAALVALLSTFLPSSAPTTGSTCGTWLSPEVTRAQARDLIQRAKGVYDDAATLPAGESVVASQQAQALGLAKSVGATFRECDATLSTRRTVALVALLVGVMVSGAIVFVAPSRKTAI